MPEEINDVDEIIRNINISLLENPNNFVLNLDLETFQQRKKIFI